MFHMHMPFWPEQNALKIKLTETNSLKNELRSQFQKDFHMNSSLQTRKSNALNNARLKLLPPVSKAEKSVTLEYTTLLLNNPPACCLLPTACHLQIGLTGYLSILILK